MTATSHLNQQHQPGYRGGVSSSIILFSISKRAAAADCTSMGLHKVTRELAGDIADIRYFNVFLRWGGWCGVEIPLLRSSPFSGMVRVVDDVRLTAGAVSTI
jgi:hypothetical protein